MELGDRIGFGRTAEIYQHDEGKILKLFYEGFPEEYVDTEYDKALIVNKLDISAPNVYYKLKIKDRFGLIYDKVDGVSINKKFFKKSVSSKELIRKFTEIQYKINLQSNIDLPSIKKIMINNINSQKDIEKYQKKVAIKILNDLKEDDKVCHGDYHPENMLLDSKGKAKAIDWMSAGRGNRLLDIARTIMLVKYGESRKKYDFLTRFKSDILKNMFLNIYMNEYSNLLGGKLDKNQLEKLLIPTLIARLAEGLDESERSELKEIISKKVKRYY